MKLPYGYESHPAADAFPMMPEGELDALAADIKENGLKQPIVLDSEGRVLDGRNRLVACQRAGMYKGEVRTETSEEEPTRFVLSANLQRRQLNKGQKALITYMLVKDEPWFKELVESKTREEWSVYHGYSTTQAREPMALVFLSGAGQATCSMACALASYPDLVEDVISGRKSIWRAHGDSGRSDRRSSSRKSKRLRHDFKAAVKEEVEKRLEKEVEKAVSESVAAGVKSRLVEMGIDTETFNPSLFYEKEKALGDANKRIKILKEELQRTKDARDNLLALSRASVPAESALSILRSSNYSRTREAVPVVLASDWHIEERILPSAVNYKNVYDLDEAKKRIGKLIEGVLWNLDLFKNKFYINSLIFWLGGDLFSGYIHDELRETNFLTPLQAQLWLQEALVNDVFNPLLLETELEQIIVPCSFGNHTRLGVRKQVKNSAYNNHEWLMYNIIAQHYHDEERIQFQIADGELTFLDVYDRRVRFTHGDTIRYMGGVGGPTICLNKAIDKWDTADQADITCMGHLHMSHVQRDAVMNSSLIGYSEFAIHIKAPYEPPQQTMFLIDSKHGMKYPNNIRV